MKKFLSIVLALNLFILISVPSFAKENEDTTEYAYVLVHGLGGWGEDSSINNLSPYWGSKTGNLAEFLRTEGYEVFEASVGPFSSSWDRACELYAQLTGTTVDYGEAHSLAHNHNRFGKTYDTPVIEDWSDSHKVNLIGHSFGGATVRVFAHLMEYGAPEEVAVSGTNTSDFFTGNKGELVHSVVTLCSPHNGSSLYDILDKFPYLIKGLLTTVSLLDKSFGKTFINHFYNTGLYHFEKIGFASGTDNAGYELSYKGATELNNKTFLSKHSYYFSYATSCTSEFNNNYYPKENTFALLVLPATLIGHYKHTTLSKENDGLVNLNSALFPFTDKYQNYNADNIESGIWNVMPILEGHHGTIIGMDGNTEEIHRFYLNLFKMIENIESRWK